jgi:hypothetical protein
MIDLLIIAEHSFFNLFTSFGLSFFNLYTYYIKKSVEN